MTSSIQINIEHVVADVAAAFAAYEKALADNDTFLINALSWEGPRTVRYGVDETQYGSEEIRKSGSDPRRIGTRILAKTTIVTTFGYEYATVNTACACDHSDIRGRRTVV